jgi:UDP-glucuronate 4-epimerase
MKILITGTAGFIGYHTAMKFINNGYEVVGLDNINNYYDIKLKYSRLNETGIDEKLIEYNTLLISNKFKNYKFIKLNLEDNELISNLFKVEKFKIVIHLAAQAGVRYSITNPDSYINSNIIGFQNILENSRIYNVEKLLYASSSSVYGLSKNETLSENDKTDSPISLYAATKKSNELFAHAYSHLYGFTTIGLRFFTVYGPWGRPDMAPFIFTDSILRQKIIQVYNHGNMHRDFTYIDDIIEGIFLISKLNIPEKHKVLNIGNSKPIKLIDFISSLESELNLKTKKVLMDLQPGDVLSTYADIKNLFDLTGYRPKINIQTGVAKFISWYIGYYKL